MSDVKQLKIEEFDLVSFVMQIQSAILQGYEVTDKSEEAPMCIGHCYHTIMREAIKPNVVVGKAVFKASLDTTKLQEQLKAGGEIDQMIADSLVVEEKTDKSEDLHETYSRIIPITDNEFVALANEASDALDKVETILDYVTEKHIEKVTQTPVKATQKQTRGKKA